MSISSFVRRLTVNLMILTITIEHFARIGEKLNQNSCLTHLCTETMHMIMSKKFKFVGFALFLLFKLRCGGGILTEHEQTQLIKSVSYQLNCRFVILLSSSIEALNREIVLEKPHNGFMQFYSGIWDFDTMIRYLNYGEVSTSKTLLVIKENSSNMKNLSRVSRRASLSSFHWLILSSLSSDIEFHFENIIIPIHCQFLVSTRKEKAIVTLYELYRISWDSELIKKKFGSWSLERGLHASASDIFGERMNLRGHQFKFAVHDLSNGEPCGAVNIDNGKQMIQCAHFDVWRDLEKVLNYTTKYVVIEDCYKKGNTGLSTPMLEMIRTGGADSGEDGYIWSSARLMHNRFFWPLYHSKVILVTKVPSRKFSFSSYLRPFDVNMWLALMTWLLLSGGIIIFINLIAEKFIHNTEHLNSKEKIADLFLPFAAICYQSSSSIPKKAAFRVAYLMVYLIPVLLIPSYSGSIISSLSVPFENVPFNDLNEFEEDGTYQLNAINNTFFQFFLMTDETFETLRQKKLVSSATTVSYEQSFRDICSKKVTFMYEWPLLTNYSINCNVFKFELTLKKIFSSMAVPKDFPYLELFNRQMQKLISSGLSNKILEKNTLKLFKHKVNPFPQNYFQIKPFEINDVLPLFAILGVGISLSLSVLIFENRLAKSQKFGRYKKGQK